MPAGPRKEVVDPDTVGVYHCWNRCVRRAWLCGFDPLTDTDYEYRRTWIEQRQALLAGLFAIEIGWHAELSNHIHLIMRNRPDVVETWSDEEVVRRVLIINRLTRNFGDQLEEPSRGEIKIAAANAEQVAAYRHRLSDISAFMASLDEYIARRANHEDSAKGHFWESRFGCRNLEDETAILVCGVYVDLNQIRAGEAATPEQSRHTSAYNRIRGARLRQENRTVETSETVEANTTCGEDPSASDITGDSPSAARQMPPDGWLCQLTLKEGPEVDVREGLSSATPWRLTDKGILPIRLEEYLSLLDWTGRQQVSGKSGCIPQSLAPILERLHIRPDRWLNTIQHFEKLFGRAIGRAENLTRRVASGGGHRIRGARHCAEAFT